MSRICAEENFEKMEELNACINCNNVIIREIKQVIKINRTDIMKIINLVKTGGG